MRRQIKAKPAGAQPCGVTSATARRILQSLERMSSPLAVSTHTHTHTIVSSVQTLFNLKVWQRLNIWYLPVNVLETLCSTCLAIMFLFENYIYLKQTHFDLSSTGCQENPSSSLIPPVSSKTLFNIFTYFDTIYNTSLYVIINHPKHEKSTEIFC